MTYTRISRRLAALAAFGPAADVLLLARLGPSCALFVDTQHYKRTAGVASPAPPAPQTTYGFDDADAFAFCCAHLSETNRAYPLAQFVAPYVRHVHRVTQADIPPLLYLLMMAIECNLRSVVDEVIAFWSAPERVAEHRKTLGGSFSASPLVSSYRIPANEADDCTVAEFLFGRSAIVGNPCTSMLAAEPFKHAISVHVLDQAMEAVCARIRELAMSTPFLTVSVPRWLLVEQSADTTPVLAIASDEARAHAERMGKRPPVRCAEWFAALDDDYTTTKDVNAAVLGSIDASTRHRARYLRIHTPDDAPAE